MGLRVLVIDDDACSLELAKYMLGHLGHDVFAARDGKAGIEQALRALPQLILCDIEMHGVGGLETLQRLRALPSLTSLAVVAVTAHSSSGDRDRLLAAGFDEHVPKPLELESLAAGIARLVQRHRWHS